MVWITALTASPVPGNEHTAAEIASGSGYSFTVTSVMMPRVPSLPTNKRVKS